MGSKRASIGHGRRITVTSTALSPLGRTVNLILGAGGGGWQLASGHYISAKMAPIIIHPRPDSETQSYEVCRRWPAGVPWEIPIVVRGGAWPFKYEKTAGHASATIGETLPFDWLSSGLQTYGVLSWTSPVVGNHSFSVRVTDQDGTITNVSWTLEVVDPENTTAFMWISTSGNNANTGSFSSPRRNIAGWYGSSKSDTTNGAKQIHYRGGTYPLTDAPVFGGSGQQVDLVTGKPRVHWGYPGETVIIDGANTAYYDWESNSTGGLGYGNLRFINPRVSESGLFRKQFLRIDTTGANRGLFFNNYYDGGGTSLSSNGSSNSSVIMLTGGPISPTYLSHSRNTFHQCDDMDFVLNYSVFDAVFEGNLVSGGYHQGNNPSWGYFIKGNEDGRHTVRANRGVNQEITRPLFHTSEFTGHRKEDFEVCWNNYRSTQSVGRSSGACALGQGDGLNGNNYGNFWSYRNNWNVDHHEPTGLGGGGPFTFENDSIQHSGVYTDGFNPVACSVSITKTNLQTGTALFDPVTNLLAGAARANLGTHGCEVQ